MECVIAQYKTRKLDAKHQKCAETFVECLEMILVEIIMRCSEFQAREHTEHAYQQSKWFMLVCIEPSIHPVISPSSFFPAFLLSFLPSPFNPPSFLPYYFSFFLSFFLSCLLASFLPFMHASIHPSSHPSMHPSSTHQSSCDLSCSASCRGVRNARHCESRFVLKSQISDWDFNKNFQWTKPKLYTIVMIIECNCSYKWDVLCIGGKYNQY